MRVAFLAHHDHLRCRSLRPIRRSATERRADVTACCDGTRWTTLAAPPRTTTPTQRHRRGRRRCAATPPGMSPPENRLPSAHRCGDDSTHTAGRDSGRTSVGTAVLIHRCMPRATSLGSITYVSVQTSSFMPQFFKERGHHPNPNQPPERSPWSPARLQRLTCHRPVNHIRPTAFSPPLGPAPIETSGVCCHSPRSAGSQNRSSFRGE